MCVSVFESQNPVVFERVLLVWFHQQKGSQRDTESEMGKRQRRKWRRMNKMMRRRRIEKRMKKRENR